MLVFQKCCKSLSVLGLYCKPQERAECTNKISFSYCYRYNNNITCAMCKVYMLQVFTAQT